MNSQNMMQNVCGVNVNAGKEAELYGGYARSSCAGEQPLPPPYSVYGGQGAGQPLYNIVYPPVYGGQAGYTGWQEQPCKYQPPPGNAKGFYSYSKTATLLEPPPPPQWYYGNYEGQKYTELPSCSRVAADSCCGGGGVKYCSIQRLPEAAGQYAAPAPPPAPCAYSAPPCRYYGAAAAGATDKREDAGNESDIIVENSDEESEAESEAEAEGEERLCVVCDAAVQRLGHDIELERTVTAHSRTRVSHKLFQLLGWVTLRQPRLVCAACMAVLNTLDALEMQLEALRHKVLLRYRASKLGLAPGLATGDQQERVRARPANRRRPAFKCRTCNKFISFQMLYKHHMAKHKRKVYKCKYCRQKLSTITAYRLHVKSHCRKKPETISEVHAKTVQIFICQVCGKTFKASSTLKDHEHLCSGELPYSCISCVKNFPSITKLNQHIRLYHEKKYTDVCKICKKGFIKNSEYKKHMLSHSSEKTYKCDVCNKVYKTLSNLNQHKKIHAEKLPFACQICLKSFLRKENLESHLNNHNGTKPFNCSVCDKTFSCKKYVEAHMKIHTEGVKKQTCHICGKQLRHGLQEHLKIHAGVRSHGCSECPMAFHTRGALAKHARRKHRPTRFL